MSLQDELNRLMAERTERENANFVLSDKIHICCHIGCENDADYIIKGPGNPSDDYTEMCDEHHLEYYDPEIDRLVKIIKVAGGKPPMTKTPQPSRDWQKDMEMCEAVKDAAWFALKPDAVAIWKRGGLMSTVWEGVDAEALYQHKEALPYWLQEAKKQYDLADELNNEVFSANCEIESINQTMKVGLERALNTTDPYEMLKVIEHLYSTLYPDTPAPKEGDI